jgi:hypothetical protein
MAAFDALAAAPATAQPPPDLARRVEALADEWKRRAHDSDAWWGRATDALEKCADDLRAALAGAAQPQAEGAPDPDDWPTCSRCGVVLVCDGTRHTTAALAAEREAGRREGIKASLKAMAFAPVLKSGASTVLSLTAAVSRLLAAPRPETPPRPSTDKEGEHR